MSFLTANCYFSMQHYLWIGGIHKWVIFLNRILFSSKICTIFISNGVGWLFFAFFEMYCLIFLILIFCICRLLSRLVRLFPSFRNWKTRQGFPKQLLGYRNIVIIICKAKLGWLILFSVARTWTTYFKGVNQSTSDAFVPPKLWRFSTCCWRLRNSSECHKSYSM